jgi:hypothetical protein
MVEVPEKLIKSPDFNREAYRTTTLLHFPQKPNGKNAEGVRGHGEEYFYHRDTEDTEFRK